MHKVEVVGINTNGVSGGWAVLVRHWIFREDVFYVSFCVCAERRKYDVRKRSPA